MRGGLFLLGGLGLGAGLMYFFDPQMGRRRRALVRDQAVRLGNDAADALRDRTRDLGNRAYGLACEARSGFLRGWESGRTAAVHGGEERPPAMPDSR